MMNYSLWLSWHGYYGTIFNVSETQYFWSENGKAQRNYLIESSYCEGAESIYVCGDKKWFTLTEFKNYLKDYVFVKR